MRPELAGDLALPDLILEDIEEHGDEQLTAYLMVKPIERVWVLIGVPAERYAEVRDLLEAASGMEDSIVETCTREERDD